MLNPRAVPWIANAVLALALASCLALLLGAPVEGVLSITNNPVNRVVVVTFALAFVGIGALSFSVHLLLHRHRQLSRELSEMRELVATAQARTGALLATADGLEARVEGALDELEDGMARERERIRAQAKAYLGSAAQEVEA
ncbi:MAG: hypothetical protein R3185_02455 [Candidatus Thermoplasmatota archaeon]|nr:hypothetical protein [Candidatus Thermoplasmatota archaeon]